MSSHTNTDKAETISEEDCFSVEVIRDLHTTPYAESIDTFLKQSPYAHPKQSIAWALCKNDPSRYFIVLTFKNERIYAYSLVYEHHSRVPGLLKYVVDGGPVVLSINALSIHLKQLLQSLNPHAAWLQVKPYLTGEDIQIANRYLQQNNFVARNVQSSTYISTINIPLNAQLSEIKTGFRRSLKTQLNKAANLGIEAKYCESEQTFIEFIDAYNQYAKNNNFGYIDHQEGINIFNRFCKNGQSGRFITIKENQQLLGGVVLLAIGNRVFFEWGYSSHQAVHRKLPLGHILQWQAITWAKEQGYELYDFGGYWPERGDDDPINRFKTGFSKNILSVMPEYTRQLSPIRCKILETLAWLRSMSGLFQN